MHSCSYLVWLVPDNNFGPLSAPSLHVMSLSIPHKMVRRGPGPGTRGVGVGTRPVPPADDFTLALVAWSRDDRCTEFVAVRSITLNYSQRSPIMIILLTLIEGLQ
jgi:hypothetical protein